MKEVQKHIVKQVCPLARMELKPLNMKHFILVFFLLLSMVSANAQTDRSAYRQIADLREQEKYLEALELANSEIGKQPDDIFLRLLKGNVLRDLERYKEALEQYDFYINKKTTNPYAFGFRAICKAKLGDRKGAMADYDRCLEMDPEIDIMFFNRAVLKSKSLDYEGAKRDYLSAIRLDSEYYQAYYKLARIYYDQNVYDSAAYYYDKELSIVPNHRLGVFERGYSRFRLDDFRGALEDFKKLEEWGDSNQNVPWVIGLSYAGLREFKEAEKYYDKCISLDSTDDKVFRERAEVRDSLKNYKGALSDLTRCIELSPKEARYYVSRGCLYADRFADKENSLRDYDKAISVKPGLDQAYYFRGLLFGERYKDFEKACADLRRAKDLGYEVSAAKYGTYCR
jgi:tetratricopeptide (TPR) repeat protein